jgi:peptidyl-prolyl cis-trans isomerase B (cyclophilin B)
MSDKVCLDTNHGKIVIELNADKAPISTENFLNYVKDEFFNSTIFHRVIPGFMIQGGGFLEDMTQKATNDPIKNEADNGLPNKRGSIAMARTPDPDSASSQFFINLKDNDFLNYSAPTAQGWGYAVFGEVVEGMDVVDSIAAVATGNMMGHGDVPLEPVIINSASIV